MPGRRAAPPVSHSATVSMSRGLEREPVCDCMFVHTSFHTISPFLQFWLFDSFNSHFSAVALSSSVFVCQDVHTLCASAWITEVWDHKRDAFLLHTPTGNHMCTKPQRMCDSSNLKSGNQIPYSIQ